MTFRESGEKREGDPYTMLFVSLSALCLPVGDGGNHLTISLFFVFFPHEVRSGQVLDLGNGTGGSFANANRHLV